MALSKPIQPVTSAYQSSYGSSSGSNMLRLCTTLSERISFEPLTSDFFGESRYLTHLKIFEKGEELFQSDSSQSTVTVGSKLRANVDPHNQNTQDIIAAMKLLSFRKQHVLVQFWSPHVGGKQKFLTNIDQPSGVGVIDERLLWYMKNSKRSVLVMGDESAEEDLDPIARVFTRGLPEWTCDVTNYLPKYFPQQASAVFCDLRGYLALPVFNSNTQLCVGVIEILMSPEYTEFAYEVKQVCDALKKQNLTCAQVCSGPAENVLSEWNKIQGLLKSVCDIHDLPLAQTWAVIPFTTFVPHETIIKKSCCSFDTKCIGKTCMSTVCLPFYVRDLSMWAFQNACRKRHLDRSRSLVGKVLLSHGSCFCEDVTKLSKEEYPLVHNAQMSRLASCFLIFLHSVESKDDYVLEFFLPHHTVDVSYVVQTLKQIIEDGSGFVLGDTAPMDFSGISDSESIVTDASESDSAIVPDTGSSADATMDKTWGASNPSKQGIKRKIDTDTVIVKVTCEGYMTNFHFLISLGLLELEKTVAERFKLQGKSLRLKYTDEDDDLILIVCDADLESALVTPASNCISLICLTD